MLRKKIVSFLIALLGVGLVSCGSSEIVSPGVFGQAFLATLTPFQAHSPTPHTPTPTAPAPSATARPSPTTTPEACLEESGQIEEKEVLFSSASSAFNFRIYTPPCFQANPDTRYPVLYMIHGQTYQDNQWERLGIGSAADALIAAGQAPFLIVMPREPDTFADIYVSSFSHDVTDGLIPWVDANYPTCSERSCRAIGGLSRGGAWALHLGITYWDLFGAIGLHSTPPFNTTPGMLAAWLQEISADQLPRIYIDIGRNDPYLYMANALETQLVENNVPHEWYLFTGSHNEEYWSSHVSDYLQWYTKPWTN